MIKVLNDEHPPVHVHVIHPDGMAVVFTDGSVLNAHQKVPASIMKAATTWVLSHETEIRAEWQRLDNPEDRGDR